MLVAIVSQLQRSCVDSYRRCVIDETIKLVGRFVVGMIEQAYQ